MLIQQGFQSNESHLRFSGGLFTFSLSTRVHGVSCSHSSLGYYGDYQKAEDKAFVYARIAIVNLSINNYFRKTSRNFSAILIIKWRSAKFFRTRVRNVN